MSSFSGASLRPVFDQSKYELWQLDNAFHNGEVSDEEYNTEVLRILNDRKNRVFELIVKTSVC